MNREDEAFALSRGLLQGDLYAQQPTNKIYTQKKQKKMGERESVNNPVR